MVAALTDKSASASSVSMAILWKLGKKIPRDSTILICFSRFLVSYLHMDISNLFFILSAILVIPYDTGCKGDIFLQLNSFQFLFSLGFYLFISIKPT